MLHLTALASPLPCPCPCCSAEQLERAVATTRRLRQDLTLSVRAWGFEPKVQEHRRRLQRHEARQQAAAARQLRRTPNSCATVAIVADSAAMAYASSPRRLLKEQE